MELGLGRQDAILALRARRRVARRSVNHQHPIHPYDSPTTQIAWHHRSTHAVVAPAPPIQSPATGLAQYELPRPGSSVAVPTGRWFEAAVQSIARQADGAPFLQLVHKQPFLRLSRLELSDSDAAGGWPAVAQRLRHTAADAVVLVQPVASGSTDACISGCCPGTAACPHAASPAAAAPAAPAAALPSISSCGGVPLSDVLAGRVGDCCDGDASSSEPHTSHHHHEQQKCAPSGAAGRPAACSESATTSYHGLVVQSQQEPGLQGCYLLKTVRTTHGSHEAGGCHCIHFTLTRVCQGQPLAQQLEASWLV